MARSFELFDLMPEIENKPGAKAMTTVGNGILFEHVCFEYEENLIFLNKKFNC